MVTEIPKVYPTSRYTVGETSKILGIHRNTLLKYTKFGRIRYGIRKSTGKKFYTGTEILSFWTKQL